MTTITHCKTSFLTVFLFLLAGIHMAVAQPIEIEWEKNYGGTGRDFALDVLVTDDGNYLVFGQTTSEDIDVINNYGGTDFWIYKVNPAGEILWSQNYGGTADEALRNAIATPDGGYFLSGYSHSNDVDLESNNGNEDFWFLKIDALGNIQWQLSVGGSRADYVSTSCLAADSSYLFTGYSLSDDGDFDDHVGEDYHGDFIVGKIDTNGNLLWMESFGKEGDDRGYTITLGSASDIYVAGVTEEFGSQDVRVLHLDENGNVIWDRAYGGTKQDGARTICYTSTGDILVTGYALSHDMDVEMHYPGTEADVWVLWLDEVGDIRRQKTFGGDGAESNRSLIELNDQSFLFAGTTDTKNNGDVTDYHEGLYTEDIWLINFDTLGVIKWQKCFGGSEDELPGAIIQLDDDSFILGGYAHSEDGDVSDIFTGPVYAPDAWLLGFTQTVTLVIYYPDADDDTYGSPYDYIYSAEPVDGYVLVAGDCDDTNPDIYPGATETINGVDDDCDGVVDLGLSIANSTSEIQIYPNPTTGIMHLQVDGSELISVSVSDVVGNILMCIEIPGINTDIDLSTFPAGVYLVAARLSQATYTVPVIKQ